MGESSKKPRRYVTVSLLAPKSGRPQLWAFCYADYAELFGVTVDTVRAMAGRGFDFGDLEAVCREWRAREARREADMARSGKATPA